MSEIKQKTAQGNNPFLVRWMETLGPTRPGEIKLDEKGHEPEEE
jgi:hypothetical protein